MYHDLWTEQLGTNDSNSVGGSHAVPKVPFSQTITQGPKGTSSSGSLLCQDAAGSGVLGWRLADPGSDLSEELVWGCEPAALESETFPRCPPGPVPVPVTRSSSMVL